MSFAIPVIGDASDIYVHAICAASAIPVRPVSFRVVDYISVPHVRTSEVSLPLSAVARVDKQS